MDGGSDSALRAHPCVPCLRYEIRIGLATSGSMSVALEGRLPSRLSDRIYTGFASLMFTQIALAAAIWTVLVGGALPYAGDLKISVAGFICGAMLGTGPVILGSVIPCFRYGVDLMDISKAVLGTRGVFVTLAGFVVMSLGWSSIGLAMICQGIGSLSVTNAVLSANQAEPLILLVGFLAIIVVFFLLRRGIRLIQRVNHFVGPVFILFTVGSLFLMLRQFGFGGLFESRIPAEQVLTTDPRTTFAYGFEFGVTMSLAWYPYLGGIFRLVKSPSHIVGPTMIGGTILGICFTVAVSAFAASRFGSPDPSVWFLQLAGPLFGTIVVIGILLLSLAAICMVVYVVAIALQQYGLLARMSWPLLVTLVLAPLLIVVMNASWVMDHVMTFATFGGLIFFSLSGVMLTDLWLLRGGRLEVVHLFVGNDSGHYWYWGGVNWCAVFVVAAGVAIYLVMYDPITMQAGDGFRYFGAAFPVILISGFLYYVLARLCVIPSGRGGYRLPREKSAGDPVFRVGL